MLPEGLKSGIEACLTGHCGDAVKVRTVSAVGGGCIHQAQRLETSHGSFFLKYNGLQEADNFKAEIKGLQLLDAANALRIPQPVAVAETDSHAFLLMVCINSGRKKEDFWEAFGSGMAALHRQTKEVYGLDHDNYIGRLPQSNTVHTDWHSFFIHERLEPQLVLAAENGLSSALLRSQFEALYARLPELMPIEPPSLLHGDLWSGNFMCDATGQAVLVDPAVYYGHREAEIAFTQLFGGFSPAFYRAYDHAWPLQQGWQERIDLYNLYPLAVHLNLFGTGYLPEIHSILRRFS